MALGREVVPPAVPIVNISCTSCSSHTVSCKRGVTVKTGDSVFLSVKYKGVGAARARRSAGSLLYGRKMKVAKLWREFFSDPSQWWDNRLGKENPNYPDFKHKKTQQSLWLDNNFNPLWVEAELAAVPLTTLKSNIFSWNLRLRRCVKAGDYEQTMDIFKQMQQEGVIPDKFTFIPVLNACSGLLALEEGRSIHLQIIKNGFDCDVFVGTCLVDMYAKCGSVEEARRAFNKMPARDVISWNALILGYVKCGKGQEALGVSQQMQQNGVDLDPVTFVGVLSACASIGALAEGKRAHEQIIHRGYECDVYVASSLVDMYAKCGSIEDAQLVFNKMPRRDVVSWSALLVGYVRCGQGQEALKLFQQMQQQGVDLDPVIFVGVLNACASIGALEEGRRAHEQIINRGYESNASVASSLIDMYSKCGSIVDAQRVFDNMPRRGVVCWNSLILAYVKCGQGQEALELSRKMQQEGLDLNSMTFVGVLNACAIIGALEEGRAAHEQIINRGYEHDVYVASSLVDMYAKCGTIKDAREVFDKMPTRDMVSWTSLIFGYVKCGQGQEALELYHKTQQQGLQLDNVTFVAVLNACASIGALEEGRHAHEQIIVEGYEDDGYVACSLVDMYAKCGSLEDAQKVFNKMPTRDVVSWNALILGYVKCGKAEEALKLSQQMQQEGVSLDPATFVGVLNACASIGKLEEGRQAHEHIIERGYESEALVAGSLVDMYAKCGSINDARRVFNNMPTRDVVAWTALILGYVRCGEGQEALKLYQLMQEDEVDLNSVTFVAVLNACASIGALEEGKRVHEEIINRGCGSDVYVASCLIDMYAKCGSIGDAWQVFSNGPERDLVFWTAMLAGYCRHGYGKEALELFEQMSQEVDLDAVSFISLLSACSHGGLVDEGMHYFESMTIVFNVSPSLEHYACVIDLLSRAGHLQEAEDLIRRMPCEPGASVWISLLGACRIHGNVQMGEHAVKQLLLLDPENAPRHVLLSNKYLQPGSGANCKPLISRGNIEVHLD